MAVSLAVKLSVLLLAATSVCTQNEPQKDGILVEEYLEHAEKEGIITRVQVQQLKKLARDMGEIETLAIRSRPLEEEPERPGVFMRMYNHLSLLNVLYFSGGVLIIGAYTLFMTLAWEMCGGGGISSVMTFQVVLSGTIGVLLWFTEEWQFLGGLLCSVSTGMVPFTVYGIQRALNLWPKEDPGGFQGFRNYVRSGWVIMEVATILVGLGYLQVVHFPFLLAPVSFCIWFLSMDLAPFFPDWYKGWRGIWEVRRQLSVAFGIGMIVTGFLMESLLGSYPDFGFWLYVFGLITFWFSVTFDFPEYDLHGSIYLLINVGLGLMGSHLNRTTFHVFGTMGVIAYVAGVVSNRIKSENSFILWLLKALAAAAFFAQAIRREGNIELLGGLVCLLAFNFDAIRFLGSGEHYYILLLTTNLGFVACSSSFQRPLPLWLFTLSDAKLPVSLVCSLTVGIFHAGLLKYLVTSPKTAYAYAYHTYRLIASVGLSFAFVFVRQSSFAWIGGLGIPLVAINYTPVLRAYFTRRRPGDLHSYGLYNLIPYTVLLFGVTFSTYLQSNLLYLVCCLCVLVLILTFLEDWKVGGCILSVGLIILAVPLQSKFMITIGAIYIFCYLSYLAYEVFKNSLLFPLALIALGILIIYSGIMYQRSETQIKAVFDSLTPTFVKYFLTQTVLTHWHPFGKSDWYYYLQQTTFTAENFLKMPFNWCVWPAALVHALAKGPVPYVSYLCIAGIVLLMVSAAVVKYRQSLVEDLDESVEVTKLRFSLSQAPAHDGHGLVVRMEGRKPADLVQPVHIALDVSGQQFWRVAAEAFGEWPTSLGRSMFLPYKLTPNLISFSGFEAGKNTFTGTVLIGTGHKGSHKMKHSTAQDAIQKLMRARSETELHLTLLYSNDWYKPYSKLCQTMTSLSSIENDISPKRH